MNINPRLFFFMAIVCSSSHADTLGFLVQSGSPTYLHSPSLQHYVEKMSSYPTATSAFHDRLQNTINYYKKIHILKTVKKATYTIDCIPFAEQPALIDNPQLAKRMLPRVIDDYKRNMGALKRMGRFFDFNPANECPAGSVAIMRPTKRTLTSEMANNKVAPVNNSNSLQIDPGYSWELGATADDELIFISTTASQAYFKSPQMQQATATNQVDRSIAQFWMFSANQLSFDNYYSVEFGIMSSAYFTPTPSTSIFVYASLDNGGPLSCYNLQCPNFIQSPGTAPFGVPINNVNVDYIFQVKHLTSKGFMSGYYLTLVAHDPGLTASSSSTLLGYYPERLYAPAHQPQYFFAGTEVFTIDPSKGTVMYGNYANPYAGYNGSKHIFSLTNNNNYYPGYTSSEPAPYGLVWHLGQEEK